MSAPERRDPQDAVFAPEELLRALPTPCYVYDEAQLRTRAARLRSAFSWSAGFRAWFPVRALPNPTVLRILREEGQSALCVTAGEYRLALASGFSDCSHFIQLFKARYGLTPLQYQKSQQKTNL